MHSPTQHLQIGAIVYPNMDQMDLTGPFEVLSRLPGSTFHLVWKSPVPIRDAHGFIITPTETISECPHLDVLIVPGGPGQQALMDDQDVLNFLRHTAAWADYLLAVCTGTLLCGAAGLLLGKRATTHWSVFHLLGYFGILPTRDRVVIDDKCVSTAGVSAGIDGALRLVSLVAGERVAQQIQLSIEYDPSPPYEAGNPDIAPPEIVEEAVASFRELTNARHQTARALASSFGYTRF